MSPPAVHTDELKSFGDLSLVEEHRTLLFGNGVALRAGLPFTPEQINQHALTRTLTLTAGPRAKDLLEALPSLMPEDALRYLRGYPLTHDDSETTEYSLLRDALIRSIARIHPIDPSGISEEILSQISEWFSQFDSIFTTNYDLLTYWARLIEPAHSKFTDLFTLYFLLGPSAIPVFRYDPTNFPNLSPFRYLHGALHLAQSGPTTEKLRVSQSRPSLTLQIQRRLLNGKDPLIVVEGSASRKLRRIKSSSYLSDAYYAFQDITGILVTYGWGFNLQDQHLVDAILRNRHLSEIWISVYDGADSPDNREMRARINRRLAAAGNAATRAKFIFYNAESVPF